MKEYELTVLIHPDLELDLEKPLEKLRGIIKDNGGEILKETNWGKKKLTYRINKQDFAVYVNFELNLPPTSLQKVSSILNITDEALRYLIVSVDSKTKAKLAEANKRKSENREEQREENNG